MTPEVAAAQFEGVGPVVSATLLTTGHIHHSWKISASGGTFLAQRCNTTVFADLEAVMGNVTRVCAVVDPQLNPIPTKGGRLLWHASDGDGVWRVGPWLSDTVPAGPGDAFVLGAGLGRWHRRAAGVTGLVVTIPHFHDPGRRFGVIAVGSDPLVARLHEHAWCATRLSGLPERVADFDAKVDNFLLSASTRAVRALVDLDTVMPGSWLWDVGDLGRSAASTAAEDSVGAFDVAVWDSVVGGYRSVMAGLLTPAEEAALNVAPVVVTWEQAVRFLADDLAGDTYYKVDYRGHNRTRAVAQLALLESMIDALGPAVVGQ